MALIKSQQDIIRERTAHYEYHPYPRWLHAVPGKGDVLVQDEYEEAEVLGREVETKEPDLQLNVTPLESNKIEELTKSTTANRGPGRPPKTAV